MSIVLSFFFVLWGSLNILDTNALDMAQICEGIPFGDTVANPLDCASYFICTDVENPTLKHCNRGLLFDAERKVCNWPNQANCHFGSTVYPVFSSTMPPETTINTESNSPISTSTASYLKWYDSVHTIGAFNKATGNAINPMVDFDNSRIQCVHFGVYFLPFPGHCNKYIICSFGHLFVHECGEGNDWDYLKNKCSVRSDTQCYSKNSDVKPELFLVYKEATVFPGHSLSETTTHKSTYYSFDVTSSKTSHPTSKSTPRYSSSIPISTTSTVFTSTTPFRTESQTETNLPRCPDDGRKAYLPYSYNCSNYYICILGTPVLTSCPNGLYWNQLGELCTSEGRNGCLDQ